MVQDFTSTNRSRTSGPWYLAIDPQHRIVRGKAYRIIKRAIDIAVVLMVSPLLLPLGYAMTCLWRARAFMCDALAVTAADGAAVMGLEDLGGRA